MYIQIDKVVHYYTVEGSNDAPALVFSNSLVEDAAHIFGVEQPEIFSRLVIGFREGISSA